MRSDMPRLLVHTSRGNGPRNDDALRVRRSKVRAAKVTHLDDYLCQEDCQEVSEWEEVSRDDAKVVCRGKTAMRQRQSGKGHSRKEFGENLKPLVRFLQKQVGRPWDKVYSEIKESCPTTGTVNAHIYQHLWDMVLKDVFIGPDGKPWQKAGAKWGTETPLTASPGSWWKALYVHPVTGLLCKAPIFKPLNDWRVCLKDVRQDRVVILRDTGQVWLSRIDPDTGAITWFSVTPNLQGSSPWTAPSRAQIQASLVNRGFEPRAAGLATNEFWRTTKGVKLLGSEIHGPVPYTSVGVSAKRGKPL